MRSKPLLYCFFLYSSLDLRTIVYLTATKFQSFVFSVLCLTVSYAADIFVIVILNDFCLFPANFCYEVINIRNLELRMHIPGLCSLW
jgi:hypothetical protein